MTIRPAWPCVVRVQRARSAAAGDPVPAIWTLGTWVAETAQVLRWRLQGLLLASGAATTVTPRMRWLDSAVTSAATRAAYIDASRSGTDSVHPSSSSAARPQGVR